MKKTIFKDIELCLTITYDQTYMDHLEADEIEYTSRTLPIFQSLLPQDTLFYGGYELAYKDKEGRQRYVYPFVTKKTTFTKCVTFFPEGKLDNLYLLDLEQALRTGQLVIEDTDNSSNKFKGFDFSKEIKIEKLLDKVVELKDGSSYIFTKISEFPEGITGKKILANGDAVDAFLAKTATIEPCFVINDAHFGWQVLSGDELISTFGMRRN